MGWKRNGIAGFAAEVLRDNKAMQAVFQKSGCKVRSQMRDDVHVYEIDFN